MTYYLKYETFFYFYLYYCIFNVYLFLYIWFDEYIKIFKIMSNAGFVADTQKPNTLQIE